MAKKVLVTNNDTRQAFEYIKIQKLEDLDNIITFGDLPTLRRDFEDGKTILINANGGYCFFNMLFQSMEDIL